MAAEKEAKKQATNEKRKATIAAKKEGEAKVKAMDSKVSNATKTSVAKAKRVEKETNEKAPKVADKVTGEYNGKKVYTGPRGGKYYINKNGNKTYVQD